MEVSPTHTLCTGLGAPALAAACLPHRPPALSRLCFPPQASLVGWSGQSMCRTSEGRGACAVAAWARALLSLATPSCPTPFRTFALHAPDLPAPTYGCPRPTRVPPSHSPHHSGWTEVLAVNVEGSYNAAHAAYPHMVSAGRGKVIFISSIAGTRSAGAQVGATAGGGGTCVCAGTDLAPRQPQRATGSTPTDRFERRSVIASASLRNRIPMHGRSLTRAARAPSCRWGDRWLLRGERTSEADGRPAAEAG